jgi:DNA repair exonuclease SbcCD ATPase subunit
MGETVSDEELIGAMFTPVTCDHLAAMAAKDAEIAKLKSDRQAVQENLQLLARAERAEQEAANQAKHVSVLRASVEHLREKCAEYNTALSDEQDRNNGLSEDLIKAEQEAAALREAIEQAVATLYEKHPPNPGNSLLLAKLRAALEAK